MKAATGFVAVLLIAMTAGAASPPPLLLTGVLVVKDGRVAVDRP